jgi:signal peptidase II
MESLKKTLPYWGGIILLILLDQYTKYLITGTFAFKLGESVPVIDGLFNITYVRNPGAAFGFLANAGRSVRAPLFLLLPVLACIWLVWLLMRSVDKNKLLSWAYTLIFAGAIGNLIDRFRLDYVVDFLDFYWGNAHFPAFNVADSCISIAAGMIILDLFLQMKKKDEQHLEHG